MVSITLINTPDPVALIESPTAKTPRVIVQITRTWEGTYIPGRRMMIVSDMLLFARLLSLF